MAQLTTFVFTDLVGSVGLKQRMPGGSAAERDAAYVERVLTPHRQRIEAGLDDAGGRVVSTAGDGHFLVFSDTVRAARWAIEVQRSHRDRPIVFDDEATETPDRPDVSVRIGLHVGAPQVDPADPDNFIGRAVDYAARLADHARAGQVLASRSAASLVEDAGLDGVRLCSHGRRELRGIGEVEIHELVYAGQQPAEPRRTAAAGEPREWTVLPHTMGLTEYVASGSGSGASATAAPVARIGNYELGELLGAGGMGNVYKARHTQFGKQRAVKIIRPDLVAAGGQSVVRRFYQEIRATGSLEHPNLVVAIDSSTPEDDQHYLVMEYVDGVGVDALLDSAGPLGVADACEIARQAAIGLEHLHHQGLVHRDVKPSNLMLTVAADPGLSASGKPRGQLPNLPVTKLMDLGLALLAQSDEERLTRMDQGGMGTGLYMSPEQWRTTSVDIRADIYSLGCTLHHLLTGEPPFARSDLRPQRAHEQETPPPLARDDVPPELQELLGRMLAKRPEDRPQTPLEVAEALAPFSAGNGLVDLIQRTKEGGGSTVRGAGGHDETSPARQANRDTRPPTPPLAPAAAVGSAASTVGQQVRWLAPTAIAILTGLFALSLTWQIGEMRTQKIAKHRETLLMTSQIAATSLATQINQRFDRLESLASQSRLAEWMQAINADPADDTLWREPQRWIIEQKSDADSKFASSSWFITDRRGVQIARSPTKSTIGDSFAHRDYFHGQGADLDPAAAAAEPPAPIDQPNLSAVYSSSKTGELKVAFSVPIFNGRRSKDAREVLGVLAMSVSLGQFTALSDAERASRSDGEGNEIEILLVDTRPDTVDGAPQRGLVLHHRLLERLRHTVRLPAPLLEAIDEAHPEDDARLFPQYGDLFDREKTYWGAFAPVVATNGGERQDTQWLIVTQEPLP